MNENKALSLISKLASLLNKKKGSDLFINANSHPAIKIEGVLHFINDVTISEDDILAIAKAITSKRQQEQFEKEHELNFMLQLPGLANYRANVYRQRGYIGMVLRLIPLKIPAIKELQLPEMFNDMVMKKRGILLYTGATGVGKSTSLAAMIDYRNHNTRDHIITLEDPIEFVHENKQCMVTQREVGIDTHSYTKAMKNALRQAPDVVLVGEIRDPEVMMQALAFAETGHLVLATIHASSAYLALERVVNFFDHSRRKQLLDDLAHNLNAIICQRLMFSKSGKGQIPAIEVMTATPHLQSLISEGRLNEINEAMERSTLTEGVITFDDYIFDLYESEKVSYEEALKYVNSPTNFKVRLRADSSIELPDELKSEEQDWELVASAETDARHNRFGVLRK